MFGLGRRWTPREKLRLFSQATTGHVTQGPMSAYRKCCARSGTSSARTTWILACCHSTSIALAVFRGHPSDSPSDAFPPVLFREVHQSHGVIACEGSMFKSKFRKRALYDDDWVRLAWLRRRINSRSVWRRSWAYGPADSEHVRALRSRFTGDHPQRRIANTLRKLSIPTELGTDTAWTFEPNPPEHARRHCGRRVGTKRLQCLCSARSTRLSGP